jgi:hypothetical protein
LKEFTLAGIEFLFPNLLKWPSDEPADDNTLPLTPGVFGTKPNPVA